MALERSNLEKKENSENKEEIIELEAKDLTIKDIYRVLDEAKKNTFNKYHRWKFSFYNEANVKDADEDSIINKHSAEYFACCVRVGDEPGKEERTTVMQTTDPNVRKAPSRL
jgi:hypothetical protein